jgi:hypothetical protein
MTREQMIMELWENKHPDYRSDRPSGDKAGVMIGPAEHDAMGWEGCTAIVYFDRLSNESIEALYGFTFSPSSTWDAPFR